MAMSWIDVKKKKPTCKRDPDELGTPVLIWPRNPEKIPSVTTDGFCYYGRRATGSSAAFYLHGAVISGVTHWQYLPEGPGDE